LRLPLLGIVEHVKGELGNPVDVPLHHGPALFDLLFPAVFESRIDHIDAALESSDNAFDTVGRTGHNLADGGEFGLKHTHFGDVGGHLNDRHDIALLVFKRRCIHNHLNGPAVLGFDLFFRGMDPAVLKGLDHLAFGAGGGQVLVGLPAVPSLEIAEVLAEPAVRLNDLEVGTLYGDVTGYFFEYL